MTRLKSLKVEGFRGINAPVSVDLDHDLIVLSGPNGTGKTSLFQSIEWGLFGRLTLSGTEFQREDAVVNAFHAGEQASVTLTLDDGMVITRTRSKKTKTGFTKRDSHLVVARGGQSWEGDEAQVVVEELLGLTADQFGAVTHLRQETIRDFIQGEPADRSQVIDRMIGLGLLREFVAGLDPTAVDGEIKNLEERVAAIDRTMIQATVLVRDMVAQQEQSLIAAGVAPEAMTAEALMDGLGAALAQLDQLGARLGIAPRTATPMAAAGAGPAIAQARAALREMGQARFTKYSQAEQAINRLSLLRDDLTRAADEARAFAGLDADALKARRADAEGKRADLAARHTALNQRVAQLGKQRQQAENVETALAEAERHLRELGLAGEAQTRLAGLLADIDRAVTEGKNARALEKLVPIALDYLKSAQPDHCPVCQQRLADIAAVIAELERDVNSNAAAARTQQAEHRWQSFKQEEQALKRQLGDIEGAEKDVQHRREDMDRLRRQVGQGSEAEGEALSAILVRQQEAASAEATTVQIDLGASATAVTELDGQLQGLQGKQRQLREARQKAVAALGVPTTTEDLVTLLAARIVQAEAERQGWQDMSGPLDQVAQALDMADRVTTIVQARESLADLERKYPTAVQEKQALQRVIDELNDIRLALQDIFQAATGHQRSIVEESLAALHPAINRRYNEILGHPVFSELQIVPEEAKKGTFIYFLRATSAGMSSTYVTTRFSTAQRNVAAVAVFLAVAEILEHNFTVLMMDDPTQSMDPEHQRAMASFMAEEARSRQVLVATEDPAFTDLILSASAKARRYELEPWTTDGTRVR